MNKNIINYKYLYLKYKYNITKYNQNGGKFIKLLNSGQQNCGIWVDIDENKIIKCEEYENEYNTIVKENIDKIFTDIFPKIYNYYYKGKGIDTKWYTEMDKLEGDLTQLLFEKVLNNVIDELVGYSYTNKLYLKYFLHNYLIPKTILKNKIYYDKISLYTLKNPDKIYSLFIQIMKYQQDKSLFEKKNITLNFNFSDGTIIDHYFTNGISYSEISKFIYQIVYYQNNIKLLQQINQYITLEIFIQFKTNFEEKLNELIPLISSQIKQLRLSLYKNNYQYIDNKLDNYGYKLEDSPKNIQDELKIEGKYIHIYILDIGSGLSKFKDNEITKQQVNSNINTDFINNLINFSKYGQYNIKTLHNKIHIHNILIDTDIPDLDNIYSIIREDKWELNIQENPKYWLNSELGWVKYTKGHSNCGIYINEKNNQIVKCTFEKEYNIIEKIIDKNIQYIFPNITNCTIINDKLDLYYIQMDKLDGDLDQLFLEKIVEISINELEKDVEIKENLQKLLDCLIYKFDYKKYIFNIPEIGDTVDTKLKEDILKYKNPIDKIDSYINVEENFSNITDDIFNDFIKIYKKKSQHYYNEIKLRLIYLFIILIKNNILYYDKKFENYGYKLEDFPQDFPQDIMNQIEPSSTELKLGDKYIHIYILDFGGSFILPSKQSQEEQKKNIEELQRIQFKHQINMYNDSIFIFNLYPIPESIKEKYLQQEFYSKIISFRTLL